MCFVIGSSSCSYNFYKLLEFENRSACEVVPVSWMGGDIEQTSVNKMLRSESGSWRLDVSSITKDVLSRTKEQAQELQSIFRRRRGDECSFRNEVNVYLTSRKEAKNVTLKSLRDIKSKCRFSPSDHENMGMVSMLREIDEVSLLVFESLLSYVSGANAQSKTSSWSSVSRFMHSKRIACNEEANDNNEFEKADSTLSTLIKTRKSSKVSPVNAQNALEKLESSIQDLEEGLDCIIRCLIKTRVSLLNILNH
ncbi:hypothetical protein SCA6_006040 [Theobroma cacao]